MGELDCKESWVPNNWCFWTGCWRKLLRVPWTVRRSSQKIRKEINPEYSLEGLMLKLKLQYFGHLMRRTDVLEKTLMLGKMEGRQRRGWQRMRWLDGITDSRDEFEEAPGVGDGQGVLACCGPWGRKESDTTEQLNWLNETKTVRCYVISCNKGCGVGGLVAKLCPTLATPWNVACQAPLSMGFSRQEYWSGLPFPSPIMKVNYYYYSPNMPSLEELGCCLTALLSLPKASSGVCLSVVSQKALPALPGFHLSRQTQKQQGLPLRTTPVRRLTPLS